MKKHTTFLALLALVASCSISSANILSASWNTTDPNNLACTYLDPFANNALDMDGIQYSTAAAMLGTIHTDGTDPTLTLGSTVNNDTGFAWQSYRVNVFMSVPFNFVPLGPLVTSSPASDWFVSSIVPVAFNGSQFEGTFYMSEGTPIGIGQSLGFLYSINFASSIDYSFTQEMIPSSLPVPEPGTLAMLGIGGLIALALRRKA